MPPAPGLWVQAYAPIFGSVPLSAAAAAAPLVVIAFCLAVLRMQAHKAALIALAAALLIAAGAWGMPAKLALLSAAQGAAFGLFPVFFIVLATLFLFNVTVRGGQFGVIRQSLAGVTDDRRIQALLIAFCFGAFIEGAAGFGAPVAIAGATLVGLGFDAFYAAGLCLVANTAPVAFGSIGIPIVTLAGVIGVGDAGLQKLSFIVGHQLPVVSLILPAYLVLIMAGPRRTAEVLPAVAVCGGAFAACQWYVSTRIGPYLPDIIASLAAMASLVVLLRFWRPAATFRFPGEAPAQAVQERPAAGAVVRAWLPYLLLTLVVLLWGVPGIKNALSRTTLMIAVPGLDRAIATIATGQPWPTPLPALFKLDYLASAGSAVLVAALVSAAACGVGVRGAASALGRTLVDMRYPALTMAGVLALAYVMNNSGMTTCLGLFATRAGRLFPFIAPILGWIGVFLTGSDTSSNVLFGGLQKTAGEQLGINPLLTAASNTTGGVMGKMISPQSLAVACAATNTVGNEGSLLRFTLRHSVALLLIVCVISYLQAYALAATLPR
ncbi:MAG TPA: L-lactate permease [Opitutaceae bacterium]|jgi:lactate permease